MRIPHERAQSPGRAISAIIIVFSAIVLAGAATAGRRRQGQTDRRNRSGTSTSARLTGPLGTACSAPTPLTPPSCRLGGYGRRRSRPVWASFRWPRPARGHRIDPDRKRGGGQERSWRLDRARSRTLRARHRPRVPPCAPRCLRPESGRHQRPPSWRESEPRDGNPHGARRAARERDTGLPERHAIRPGSRRSADSRRGAPRPRRGGGSTQPRRASALIMR